MKIAIVTFSNLPVPPVEGGAVETLLDYICTENEKFLRLEIDVFGIYSEEAETAIKERSTQYTFLRHKKIRKYSFANIFNRLFNTRKFLNSNIKKYICEINKKNYDFVIVTSIFKELEYVIDKLNSPVIWYLHADALSVLDKNDIKKILLNCCGVITVSDFVSNRIKSLSPKCKVLTVKNCSGITPIDDNIEKDVSLQVRKNYKILPNDILFTYVGRITRIKGIKELVTAFNGLNVKNKKLLIVGAPMVQADFEYLAEIKSICDDNVIFAGYIDNQKLNSIFCATNAAVVPSICLEAAPLSVIEPQICGRYVICSNVGGVSEYCENGNLVEFNDKFSDNLRDAMNDFCNNMILYNSKCKKITKYNKETYYNDFCNALKIIYEERKLCQD